MTVLAIDSVVQTALVEVFLGDVQPAICSRAFHCCVLAVQHDMVVHVDAVIRPSTSCSCVGTPDNELVKHVSYDLRRGSEVPVGVDLHATGGTCLAGARLWLPGMVETVTTKGVLAGQLDGLVEGGVADEADEVAVGLADVVEGLELGGHFDDAAPATLRRG